ncbi:unnamed protein product [Chironomus riparius]|uniref:Peptidase S1 domain-containing protein n=1 Tax=Chironomus riparius TaxID=315576 RepID=A0A9P0NE80_9DIPT|nr:unnamed protein product [Chironomus riparius]
MKNLDIGFLVILSLATVDLKIISKKIWQPYIHGGEDVRNFSNFSYILSMRYIDFHICGASIIHLRWALTAAHCFDDTHFVDAVSFRGGSVNRFIGGKIIHAEQFFIHPQYNAPTYAFDVAVVRTIEDLSGDHMSPIRLIGFNTMLPAGLVGSIAGWGVTSSGSLSINLQQLDLPIWNQRDCSERWSQRVNLNKFCAGGTAGFDSCNGDSGGPMVVNGMQVGIISAGATDCGIAFPSLFVNITHPSIRAFIMERTRV